MPLGTPPAVDTTSCWCIKYLTRHEYGLVCDSFRVTTASPRTVTQLLHVMHAAVRSSTYSCVLVAGMLSSCASAYLYAFSLPALAAVVRQPQRCQLPNSQLRNC